MVSFIDFAAARDKTPPRARARHQGHAPPDYAELQVATNFSFLRGGSHADELVATAHALGLKGLAITDHNTLSGVVRAHLAARTLKLPLAIGCRLDLTTPAGPEPGTDIHNQSVLAYPTDRAAYGRLCQLITLGQRRAPKGQCWIGLDDLATHAKGFVLGAIPPSDGALDAGETRNFFNSVRELGAGAGYLAASCPYGDRDRARLHQLNALARTAGLRLLATQDVRYHSPDRKPLYDVLTCIRHKTTIANAGLLLDTNAERYIKSPRDMAILFSEYPDALAASLDILHACNFSLEELVYEYPDEPVPPGRTPQDHLEALTWAGAQWRYPNGVPEAVRATLDRELALIAQLGYAPYFLTVHDIVRFARASGILCQGRGSAANSAVCYCLGITNVNPSEVSLLFDRFISPERKEPPDIDVDFEHERREEVIQYIYARYGRERAGLAATVISYRGRSAIREVGKAMGLADDTVAALAGTVWGARSGGLNADYIAERGLDPSDPRLARTLELARELIGFPRHLSQHVGGFVLTRGPLSELVPIGNAAMDNRTVIEWDKDDITALGLMKVDVLALGMLSCIRKSLTLLTDHYARPLDLGRLPREDQAVYDMLCRADSVGVFQVESRAQMNMLPRLRPRCFYDLVIEVAIVRPGPIQGDMVHPYLRRRMGLEAEDIPSPGPHAGPADELRQILSKTKGVPLFQEQAMRIAMVAANFSGEEVNALRHAMATFRKRGTIGNLEEIMVTRMIARGYEPEFAKRCFNQIKGFGEYGFPESHAASFAHLVYVSAWLKCHYPAVFACALINSQPMGFYAPAQLVRDARDHGVAVRPVDVNASTWDCTLETTAEPGTLALRLGLRLVEGLARAEADTLVTARARHGRPFESLEELWQTSRITPATLKILAAADAFGSLGLNRRAALWAVSGLKSTKPLPLFAWSDAPEMGTEPAVHLPEMALPEQVITDYQTLKLSLKAHPMAFLRDHLTQARAKTAHDISGLRHGTRTRFAGVILVRQRPGSAKGVVFMTLEDETGVVNAVVWPSVLEANRATVMGARLMEIHGRIQRQDDIVHLVAERLIDRSAWLYHLADPEATRASGGRSPRDTAALALLPLARADEVANPGPDPYPLEPPGHPAADPPISERCPKPASWTPGKHPREERMLPKSRDFH